MPVLKYRPDESSSWQTVGITADGYTKEETDTLLANKADTSSVYTKTESDTLLQNKAPAGYGLGASSKNVTDWNNEKTNGWVRDPSGTEDKHSPFVGLFSVGLISDYNSGEDAFQLAFARDQFKKTRTYIKFRAYNADDKVWREWEWVNPPMIPGKEYRTTERYQGKPVYAKRIHCESMPSSAGYIDIQPSDTEVPNALISTAIVIRCYGRASVNATIPFYASPNDFMQVGSVFNNTIRIYTAKAYGGTAEITVYYTKTTD